MKPYPAAVAAIAVLAAAAPAAQAATLTASPAKRCYRHGEHVLLAGTGFTPNGSVTVERDGTPFQLRPLTDPTGAFPADLKVAQATGQSTRTYTATDVTDPQLTASTRLTVSAVEVKVRPDNGAPGRVLRIGARGFTDGKTLYAHVIRRGRLVRTLRIGRLRGSCGKLVARKRLLARNTKLGDYRVQFDSRRAYRSRTEPKFTFSVVVSNTARASSAGGWRRLR
jgi:hypothetical protein